MASFRRSYSQGKADGGFDAARETVCREKFKVWWSKTHDRRSSTDATSLMPNFDLRSLEPSDLDKGYLALLSQLTSVDDPSPDALRERLAEIQSNKCIHIRVMEDVDQSRIIASGTLFIEPKFIHNCGAVGHIEDVVVDAGYRGQGLGKSIVKGLIALAKTSGCYKVILDCYEQNVHFYEQCGLKRHGIEMARYFDDERHP